MDDRKIHTVDTLKKILDSLHDGGYGDMPILLGENTPLLKDSICIDIYNKKLLIRNSYYDTQLQNAATKLKASIDIAIKDYLHDCFDAGINIKED